MKKEINYIQNGVYKLVIGTPIKSCVELFNIAPSENLADIENLPCPFTEDDFIIKKTKRGMLIEMQPNAGEHFYGLGLMLKSFCHNGTRKRLRTNADPIKDTGDSHAPVPFLISTANYGILVDSLRGVTFDIVNAAEKRNRLEEEQKKYTVATDTDALYGKNTEYAEKKLHIEIPYAEGVNLYIFVGSDMQNVVERYNLFFGGGCMPSLAGIGVLYRAYGQADEKDVKRLANSIREDKIPCDNFGLEPGWQTHAYSCSYMINREKFPHFEEMLVELRKDHFHVNAWEHAFIRNASPIYEKMYPYAGDFEVWQGLVPDFFMEEGVEIFNNHHQQFIDMGLESIKLDECDGSDYTGGWTFPDYAEFPSGLDGEEMHAVFGHIYAETFEKLFRKNNMRHLSQCRSNYIGASNQPFVVASDLYDHSDFLMGTVNCGFSGLVWSPEVRQTKSEEELLRRLELVSLSPYCCINMWMVPQAPWKQWEYKLNREGILLDNADELTAKCRVILERRMQLLPYLYTAYFKYRKDGTPPVKAVIMNYQDDENTYELSDEYLFGDDILIAPFIADKSEPSRNVYLPKGIWYDFHTGEKIEGGKTFEVEREGKAIPMYVRKGAILPIAAVRQYVPAQGEQFEITLRVYGDGKAECMLFEDDTTTFDFEKGVYNVLNVSVNETNAFKVEKHGTYAGTLYKINGVERIV